MITRPSIGQVLFVALMFCIVFGNTGCASVQPSLSLNKIDLGKGQVITVTNRKIVYTAKW